MNLCGSDIPIDAGIANNTAIGVFSGSCGGTQVVCGRSQVCGKNNTQVSFQTPGAGTYLICVMVTSVVAPVGVVHVEAYPSVAPSNDVCSGALPVSDGDNIVHNRLATQDTTIPCIRRLNAGQINFTDAQLSGADVWYTYTAPATGVRNIQMSRFHTNSQGTRDSTLAIYSACGGTLLACDDNSGLGSQLPKIHHFPVAAGTTYTIRLSNVGAVANTGLGVLNIAVPPTPAPFDDCTMAVPVLGQPMTVPYDTTNLTTDARDFDCDSSTVLPGHHDGWFAWTPSTSGIARISNVGLITTGRTNLALYDSCQAAPLACFSTFYPTQGQTSDSTLNTGYPGNNGFLASRLCYPVVAGQTYLVRIAAVDLLEALGNAAAIGSLEFDVQVAETYSPPANAIAETGGCGVNITTDVNGGCQGSLQYTPISLCQTYTGTVPVPIVDTLHRDPLQPTSFLMAGDSDWYEFTLSASDTVTLTGQSRFTPRFNIYSPTCVGVNPLAQMTPLASFTKNPNCSGVNDISLTTPLAAGTYWLAVLSEGSGAVSRQCGTEGVEYWFMLSGSVPCPGACCNGTTCTSVAQVDCTGSFKGVGAPCEAPGNPTTCCPVNYDGINGLQVADIFAFLNSWFAGETRADFDGLNGLQVADIFAFLNAWFAGC